MPDSLKEVSRNEVRTSASVPNHGLPWLTRLWPIEGEDYVAWVDRFQLRQLTALVTCIELIATFKLTSDQVMGAKISEMIKIRPVEKRDALIEAARLVRVFEITHVQLTTRFLDDIASIAERTAARLFSKANMKSRPDLILVMNNLRKGTGGRTKVYEDICGDTAPSSFH